MKDELIDSESKLKYRKYEITVRVIIIISILFIMYSFLRYYIIKQSLNNPFLPEYTTGFVFGEEAMNGFIVACGILMGQILYWSKKYFAAMIVMLLAFIISGSLTLVLFK